jgi:aspartyl-tRNA(Asn)/glutamyl-tRNA(Gln) amidotransferase subunit C
MLASGVPGRLTKVEVEAVAALARLDLTDDEKKLYGRQLASILDFVAEIAELDTTSVFAAAHILEPQPSGRSDTIQPGLTGREALDNAPDAQPGSGLFRVPRVLE